MLQPAFAIHQILAELPSGGLVLTPTNRLRNRCLQVYGSIQVGNKNWLPPAVESLQSWLDKLWFTLQQKHWPPAFKLILNREQRQLLWQRTLGQSVERGWLNIPQMCRDADGALTQLLQWRLLDGLSSIEVSIDQHLQQFALERAGFPLFDMLQTFERQLQQHNAITPDQRDLLIARAFEEGVLPKLPVLALAGFAQLAPLTEQITKLAAEKVESIEPQRLTADIKVAPCHDLEEELTQAARWSAELLAEKQNPSIGIVVNNLGQCRALVESIFAQVLEPQWCNPQQHRYTLPFNFSAGIPLAQTPIGSGSLLLLEWLRDQWDYPQLKKLLFSPFWGEGDELKLRSALFRSLQKLELWRVDGPTLRYWATKLTSELSLQSTLPQQLQQLAERARRWQQAPAEIWAQRFSQLLLDLGWPGPRNPDSQEYQQLKLWQSALENFAGLDRFAGRLSLSQALQLLSQIAHRTPFQAETRDSPLQILGVLEAGGLSFDHLRLVGFGQQQWPPPPSPNPMLPRQWQKHWNMPRASAERELELACQLSCDLQTASTDIVVSFACEQDGIKQSLSPLFANGSLVPPAPLDPMYGHYQLLKKQQLQSLADAQLPPLGAKDCQRLRGGAGVLQAQALCPLNTQLHYRLGAKAYQRPSIGLNAADRGNLMHQVLASFWQLCGNSKVLATITEKALQHLIHRAVDGAVQALQKQRKFLPAGFWALEKTRLYSILQQWLEQEKTRPMFQVSEIESERQVELGGLKFTLRLDRLDTLENGEQLIIDYKTGQPSISAWLQRRIREPQLPLYALFQPEARAIAFAQVRNGDCKYKGCGELNNTINGIKGVAECQKEGPFSHWQQLVEFWHSDLNNLAIEYRRGHAELSFQRPTDNSAQSELWPLNRWPERRGEHH
ncbi:MAG: PD-(D/E)XK nuclease family protein [Gammaproteobacteria bacterium]|nr:PD-(D/E)XK nuclease family protein [Gammaproteobacteria bacterium]